MPDALTIHCVLQVEPTRIALQSGSATLTHGALQARAAALAKRLRQQGITVGSTVAVCLPRGFDQIVAQVAAAYAGAAFVPVDISWPDERMQFILQDSGAAVMIAEKALAERLAAKAIAIDPAEEALDDAHCVGDDAHSFSGDADCSSAITATDIAYVIYTSGSTGEPKGCEITHGNLKHLVDWHLAAFAVGANDRASHMAGLGFDASVWEVWPYLAAGACVCLVDDATRVDATALQQWLVREKIDLCFVPTPMAELLIAMPWDASLEDAPLRLRTMLTGGDTLHSAPPASLPFTLVNNYGPTECTVVATSGPVRAGEAGLPSIGRVIPGATGYILDEAGKPSANGEGELYVGGAGVGAGYRNLPDQTQERFLADPFASTAGARMYRTGDRVKRLPNGELAFLGRVDNQVKIRGYRMELEEISNVLNRHAAVSFSVVVPSPEPGVEHLVAYVLPTAGAETSARALQEFLGNTLPHYMVPAQFVKIDALPLTSNGKVNRSVLPLPCAANALSEAAVPSGELSEVEATLLEIVRTLLQNPDVTIEDDFFLIGGHSLMGTQIVLRVREIFGIELSLAELFEAGTVAALAARIEERILERLESMSDEEAVRLMEMQ